ncbi:MAG: ParB/RepB/Spo0J family partition protein [Clostridia bacterium]
MAKENKGLGRGLSALIGINDMNMSDNSNLTEEKSTNNNDNTQINDKITPEYVDNNPIFVLLTDIDPNFEQPRKFFDETALRELSDSIKIHGVIQPLIINRMGKRFMIIAGERRYRAAKMAGLTHVPAIVKNYSQQEVREISLIENLQREDLNAIEAARAIKALMDEFGLTQDETAQRIGKNRSTIANTLRLLTLDESVIQMIETGRLSAGHARALVAIENKEIQLKFAQKAENENMSVRNIEQLVKNFLNPPKIEEKIVKKQSVELKTLVLDMQRVFATKVTAASNGDKGRIYIDFYNNDDLERIVKLVNKWISENM